jgi:hypothetical protein
VGQLGQLPNFDLVTMIGSIASSLNVPIEVNQNRYSSDFSDFILKGLSSIFPDITSWKLLDWDHIINWISYSTIDPTRSNSLHSAFLGFQINSLTMRLTRKNAYNQIPNKKLIMYFFQYHFHIKNLFRIQEAVIHSVSDLYEQLHHSTFQYIPLSRDQYIEFEKYLVSLLLPLFSIIFVSIFF